jgi:hypothetical protein
MTIAAQAAVNTTLAAGCAALTCLLLAVLLGLPGDIGPLLNGEGRFPATGPCSWPGRLPGSGLALWVLP